MSNNYDDSLSWSLELEKHFCGEISCSSVQSHLCIEDKLQIDCCSTATFIGLYDGFKGDEASNFLRERFFPSLLKKITDHTEKIKTNDVPPDAVIKLIRKTFSTVEEDFTKFAECGFRDNNPYMSVVSSGCLICLIWGKKLFAANVGESRAIICYDKSDGTPGFCGKQIVKDHSCEKLDISENVQVSYPASRCIGNAYLKMAYFTKNESFEAPGDERLESVFTEPLLSAKPEVYTRDINDTDRFIIFGSGGFWKLLTNEEAAKVVNSHSRHGIARRLATRAVKIAAEKRGLSYNQIMLVPEGIDRSGRPRLSPEPVRPIYHDDITVTVVFLDIDKNVESKTFYSYHSHSYNVLPSGFKDELVNFLS